MANNFKAILESFRIENEVTRQFLAEFLGTAFLVLIGTAANIQAQTPETGSSTTAHIAWGLGFMFAVYIAANVSGAHLNPAMSLMFCMHGDLEFGRMIVYWVAQYLGAIVGTLISFLGHLDDILTLGNDEFDVLGENGTAGLFSAPPAENMTNLSFFFNQVIGTAILSGMIVLITDKKQNIPSYIVPILAGATMSMIAMSFGDNGFSINPARDLGPRILLIIVGYGGEVFSQHSFYFWIPIVAAHVGAIIGAWIYYAFVGIHIEAGEMDVTVPEHIPRRTQIDDFDVPPNPTSGLENLVGFRKITSTRYY